MRKLLYLQRIDDSYPQTKWYEIHQRKIVMKVYATRLWSYCIHLIQEYVNSKISWFEKYLHLVIGWGNMIFLSWILVVQFSPLFTRPTLLLLLFFIIIMVTLVCMGCHNKILQTMELRQQTFISSAGWYPRSRWWLGWFLVNPLFLPCIGHLSLCLCMTFILCTCARESSLSLPLLIRMPVLSD